MKSSLRLIQPKTFRPLTLPIYRTSASKLQTHPFTCSAVKMASFSNTNTGDKLADPYKEKNLDQVSIEEKINDLSEFISACKFGMMTTRDASTGYLTSRCMALAAKVLPFFRISSLITSKQSQSDKSHPGKRRHRPNIPHQHRIRQNRRTRLRPSHQHRLPQFLRRMGIYLRPSSHNHRPRLRQEILLKSTQSLARRSR